MPAENLVIFSSHFPFQGGEVFLRRELPYLASSFQRILIIPTYAKGNQEKLPSNVQVKVLPDIWQVPKSLAWKVVFRHGFRILTMFVSEWLREPLSRKKAKENFALVRYFFALTEELRSVEREFSPENTLWYSYWCNDRATIIGMLRKMNRIQKGISRAHGFDLYPEQNPYIRFRKFQLQHLDFLVTISQGGLEYLEEHFPASPCAFRCFPLGAESRHQENPFSTEAVFTIVSCSVIASHKRVKKMAEAICQLGFPVRWVHFGDGPEKEEVNAIIQKAASPFLNAVFRGQVSNEEVLDYYAKEPVSLFLNFSDVEGIPFSMMEAISFGIPCMGADIGAIREIVSGETGKLLKADSTPEELANAISEFKSSEKNSPGFRLGVRQFFDRHYSAEKNFVSFVRFLKEI